MNIPDHAQQRISQRGLTEPDVALIVAYGTETKDGFFLRQQDVRAVEGELKILLSALDRLRGKYVVLSGETVITAYHPTKPKVKRILRNAQCR
jgi:hypothetical protein